MIFCCIPTVSHSPCVPVKKRLLWAEKVVPQTVFASSRQIHLHLIHIKVIKSTSSFYFHFILLEHILDQMWFQLERRSLCFTSGCVLLTQ